MQRDGGADLALNWHRLRAVARILCSSLDDEIWQQLNSFDADSTRRAVEIALRPLHRDAPSLYVSANAAVQAQVEIFCARQTDLVRSVLGAWCEAKPRARTFLAWTSTSVKGNWWEEGAVDLKRPQLFLDLQDADATCRSQQSGPLQGPRIWSSDGAQDEFSDTVRLTEVVVPSRDPRSRWCDAGTRLYFDTARHKFAERFGPDGNAKPDRHLWLPAPGDDQTMRPLLESMLADCGLVVSDVCRLVTDYLPQAFLLWLLVRDLFSWRPPRASRFLQQNPASPSAQ